MHNMGTVYALLVDAEADEGNEYAKGERKNVLVLVPARSPDEASAEAVIALAEKRWKQGQVHQIEPFTVPLASVADPVMREAAGKAFAGDRAIVVYERA